MEEASSCNIKITDLDDSMEEAYYSSDPWMEYFEADLEGKINQLLEALSTTQMITENQENTDMERASISHHVKDLVGKINEMLVPLSTTQMITNHFNLNQENDDMERASISHHVKDLEGKINQVLVPLSTTHMITKHYKLNRVNNDMERASISHPVEDLEGKIKQLIEHLSKTQEIIKMYKLCLENAAAGIEDELEKRVEERMKKSNVNLDHYRLLIRAIKDNNVKAQKDFLKENPDAMKSEIDEFGNTVFHLIVQRSVNSATVKLLKDLVSKVLVDSPATLEILDVNGLTALDIAAAAGNTEAVKVFAKKCKHLLSKEQEASKMLPVHSAAYWGQKETVRYLLSMTDWTEESALVYGALLLIMLIESNLFGIALGLLKHYPHLALRERNNFWNDTVNTLATKYRAFESGTKLGFWERLIYQYIPVKDNPDHIAWPSGDSEDGDLEKQNHKCSEKFPILPQIAATFEGLGPKLWDALIQLVPSIKRIHDQKLMHTQTLEIVRLMISKVDWSYKEASERLKNPVLIAARLGIHEFVDEVLKAYQNSVLFYDKNRRNIFLLAVFYRKEKVFNLIHDQMALIRDHVAFFRDIERGNILHVAAKFVHSSQIPGAALQMQRELQWFKSVRDLFPSRLEEQLNKAGEIPEEVFTKEHKDLVGKGEKWMRDTATSCSVVAALIITIVFAAAFTVPGGINSNGIPNYLEETYFRIFAISTAIALFSSTTSVQMFLGMLTSRYTEEDFLELLPRKLIIGLMTLFLSSSSMMTAFGAAFCIALYHPWKWVITLICLLGCIPITLFAWMQFPLLVDIFRSTYGPNFLNPMKR